MDKVVDLEKRVEDKKKKKQAERNRVKSGAIVKFIQCSSCHFRCAMCGYQMGDKQDRGRHAPSCGLNLCKDCRQEFEDFLSITRGKKQPEVLWHNKEWLTMWSAWLNFRKTVASFMNSKEFRSLLEELKG